MTEYEYKTHTFKLKRRRTIRERYQQARLRWRLWRDPELRRSVDEMRKEVDRRMIFGPDDR